MRTEQRGIDAIYSGCCPLQECLLAGSWCSMSNGRALTRPDTVLAPVASNAASALLFRWPKVWLWGPLYGEAHELRSAPSTPPAMLEYMWCYRCLPRARVKADESDDSGQVAGRLLAAIRCTAEESYPSIPNFKLQPRSWLLTASPCLAALAVSPAQKMSSAGCPPSLPTYTKSYYQTPKRTHNSPIHTIIRRDNAAGNR